MPRKKLRRFAELDTFANVFHNPVYLKGKWRAEVFKNDNPITLELGCGKGDYTVALAERFPDRNIIGVDAKGARMWSGAKAARDRQLHNTAFARMFIERLGECFAAGEVNEIWITFPDPFPKSDKAKRRLTSPRFLNLYRTLLAPGGSINLKTDNDELFHYSIGSVAASNGKILAMTSDLYCAALDNELLYIQTTYERRHLASGKTIKYLSFTFE